MGACTTLFIDSRHSIEDIVRVVERSFETKVKTEYTHSPNYLTITFDLANDQKRMLSVHTSYHHSGFTGTYLSLGVSGRAVDVMQAIAKVFGGYLQEYDGDNKCDSYAGKLTNSDGLAFWVNYAIVEGIDHKDVVALGQFIDKTKKKWQK